MNTSPEKLFLFQNKTFVEPFSNFFGITDVLLCKRDEVIVRCCQVKDYGGSDFKVSFASFDV
jgi:hypothetical protein